MANGTPEPLSLPPSRSIFDRMAAWMGLRMRAIMFALGATFVMSGAGFGYHQWSDRRDRKASDAFEKAIGEAPEQGDPEKMVAAMDQFMKDHGGSSMAGIALIYRSKALLEVGKLEPALDGFQQATKRFNKPYRYLAMEGEAAALTELNRVSEAEAVYRALVTAEDYPSRTVAYWNLGMLLEENHRPKEALQIYQEFETKFPESPLLEKVRTRLSDLRQGSPAK